MSGMFSSFLPVEVETIRVDLRKRGKVSANQMNTEIQDRSMRQFLLGDLPDSDATALELELLRNDEKFEQMWELENELVDAYVRERLTTLERERFERHYLASPVHVQRVAMARRLI